MRVVPATNSTSDALGDRAHRTDERYELCLPPISKYEPSPINSPLVAALGSDSAVHLAYWALPVEEDIDTVRATLLALKSQLLPHGVCYLHCPNAAVLAWAHICAEIVLGADNFIATLVDAAQAQLPPKGRRARQQPAPQEQLSYVLMFARSVTDFKLGRLPRTAAANGRYHNCDNDPRGPWTSGDLSVKTYKAECDYPITTPSGRVVNPPPGLCWRMPRESMERAISEQRIWFGAHGNNRPRLKRFLSELKHEGMVPLSLILPESLQDASSPELALAARLIHIANLNQAPKTASCLLLGERARCAVMAQALTSGRAHPPHIWWPQQP